MGGRFRSFAFVALVVVIVLATTGTWNPWPALWARLTAADPVAPGAAAWQARIGGTPRSVTVTGGAVVVEHRTSVETYALAGGARLWESDADWAAVAGRPADAVVVVGRLLVKGYQVLDPATGAVRRADPAAVAVWTTADGLLDLTCPGPGDCELRSWAPRGARPRWTAATPGVGAVLLADNPALAAARTAGTGRTAADAAGPRPAPPLVGLPVDGGVQLVDTATGRVTGTVATGPDRRVAVAGGRVLTVTATARDGTCYYAVSATGPRPGEPVWRRPGLNLRTAADPAGCAQDRDPVGGRTAVAGADPYGRPELVAVRDGRTVWRGAAGERITAVEDGYALVRSADGRTVRSVPLAGGRPWRRALGDGGAAAATPWAAVVTAEQPARLTALRPATGAVLLDVRTPAKVVAAAPGGLVVLDGRELAYLPFR